MAYSSTEIQDVEHYIVLEDGTEKLVLRRFDGSLIEVVVGAAAGGSGEPGPQGDPGPVGPAGPIGPIGPQGVPGNAGAQGPPGNTGAQGPAGAAGPTGPQGNTGATGAAGAAGATGAQGPSGNIELGSCETVTGIIPNATVNQWTDIPGMTMTFVVGARPFAFMLAAHFQGVQGTSTLDAIIPMAIRIVDQTNADAEVLRLTGKVVANQILGLAVPRRMSGIAQGTSKTYRVQCAYTGAASSGASGIVIANAVWPISASAVER